MLIPELERGAARLDGGSTLTQRIEVASAYVKDMTTP